MASEDVPGALTATDSRRLAGRLLLVLPAAISLLGGLGTAAAMVLDGEGGPATGNSHGILMTLGFLGTLIAVERAVALRRGWGFAAPVALGLGGLALLLPLPVVVPQVLLVVGCALAMAVLGALLRRQHDEATATQVLAASLALGAAVLWVRVEVAALVPWPVGYIVLTVVAERVELARIGLPRSAGTTLLGVATLLHAGVVASALWPVGSRVFGAALLVTVAWIARVDIARRTVRTRGLPRFCAAAMLLGYGWLAVAGSTWLIGGVPASVAGYDTVVHTSFLGFAISMVMAHAPIILPAVLRVGLPYRRALWGPLAVLHVGLAVRLIGGNAAGSLLAWQLGAWLTIVSLLAFAGTAVWCSVTGRKGAPRPPVRPGRPVNAVAAEQGSR